MRTTKSLSHTTTPIPETRMKKTLPLSLLLGLAPLAAWAAVEKPTAPDSKPALSATPAKSTWSPYQAVKPPAVPQVQRKSWVRTPIDAFVLAKLEAKGL